MFCTFGSRLASLPVPVARWSKVEWTTPPPSREYFMKGCTKAENIFDSSLCFISIFGTTQSGSGSFASSSSTSMLVEYEPPPFVVFIGGSISLPKSRSPTCFGDARFMFSPVYSFMSASPFAMLCASSAPSASSFAASACIPSVCIPASAGASGMSISSMTFARPYLSIPCASVSLYLKRRSARPRPAFTGSPKLLSIPAAPPRSGWSR